MNSQKTIALVSAAAAGLALAATALDARAWQAQPTEKAKAAPKLGYTDTPLQPYGTYRVHDGTRPQPAVVDPGTPSTQDAPGRPPADAVVLFDGKDLAK